MHIRFPASHGLQDQHRLMSHHNLEDTEPSHYETWSVESSSRTLVVEQVKCELAGEVWYVAVSVW